MTDILKAAASFTCLALSLLSAGCSASRHAVALGQPVPMEDGELTIVRSEVSTAEGRRQFAVYFRWTGPTRDLLTGFFSPKLRMALSDGAGHKYQPTRPKWSPIQPVPEESYGMMRHFDSFYESHGADKTFDADLVNYAERVKKLEADVKAGRNPIAWVHVFQVPLDSQDLALIAENAGQAIEVPLGR